MIKKLFILSAFFGVSLMANAQIWVQQNTNFTGTSIGVDEISVVDANIVWVKGFNGSGTGDSRRSIYSKTIDGGTTWTAGAIGVTGTIMPSTFAASNAMKCFVAAIDTVSSVASFWGTYDGGATWATVGTILNSSTSFADGVKFWDGNKGFCYGDPTGTPKQFECYYTTDGGTTWTPAVTSVAPSPAAEYGYNGGDCSAIVRGTGIGFIITDHGRVLKTTDYGMNWALTAAPAFSSTAQLASVKIYASSANNIIAANLTTSTSTAWTWVISSDGGASWTSYTPSGKFYDYAMCHLPGTTNRYVSTSPSTTNGAGVSYTVDGGANWTDFTDALLQPSGTNIQCLAVGFYDVTTGWVGNYDAAQSINSILKYHDVTAGVPIQQTLNGNDVNIYPNPSNGLVNFDISGPNAGDINISVFDVMGKLIFNQTLNTHGIMNSFFDFSSYAMGVYLVKLTSGTETTTKKLMIR